MAFLDKDSGKAFIAALVVRPRLVSGGVAAAAAPAGETAAGGRQRWQVPLPPPWLGVFLVPRVALVQQQAAYLNLLFSRAAHAAGAFLARYS